MHIPSWHVMRISYHRELKLQAYLQSIGVQCYVPTKREKLYDKKGNLVVKVRSLVPNYIFVHDTTQGIYELKHSLPAEFPLMYVYDKSTRQPMIVPDKMMTDFMEETQNVDNAILYLDHPEDVFKKGTRVRVTYGPLKGREGYVLRIKRERRFVLSLEGLVSAAVMTADNFRFDWAEPIE